MIVIESPPRALLGFACVDQLGLQKHTLAQPARERDMASGNMPSRPKA